MEPFLLIIMLIIVVAAMIHGHRKARRRRQVMQGLAAEMGFHFDPDRNRNLAAGFEFIKHLKQGGNRYAYNILSGKSPKGEPVLIFDFHYEINSGKTTTHFELSVMSLTLPRSFPELQIEPEGFGSILKHMVGFNDIDFESLEFSKRYDVRSMDKKFAYDFCNSQMIDYLMRHRDFIIEVDQRNLVLIFNDLLPPVLCRANYRRMLEIRDLMPDYLFS